MTEVSKIEIRGEEYDLKVLKRMIERIEANARQSRDTALDLTTQAIELLREAELDDQQADRYRKMLAMYEAAK